MQKISDNKVKNDLLMAMYRSVDRMNDHWVNGNNGGVIAEKWLQVNLRQNFEEIGL